MSVRSSSGGVFFSARGDAPDITESIFVLGLVPVLSLRVRGAPDGPKGPGQSKSFFLFQIKEWTEHLADSSELR